MRIRVGELLARFATWIAGECPCLRCRRMTVNRALMNGLPRHQRRQLARDIVSGRRGGPAT